MVGDEGQDLKGVGLYLTDTRSPQLRPISIGGVAQENANAAFYSYCRFVFDWDDILTTTWERLAREKYFLGFYLLLVGLIGFLMISQKSERKKINSNK